MREQSEPRLLTAEEAGEILHLSERTIQEYGRTWMMNATTQSDGELSSSYTNGLRPTLVGKRRRRYDPRDVDEYKENATREAVGVPTVTWRKGGVR